MLIVVHWVLLTWVIVNCSAHVDDRNRHTKHEMFRFEKTVFKIFELLLEYLIFRKTV